MKSVITWAEREIMPRCYIAAAELANFRGHPGVSVQLFRTRASDDELEQIRGLGLVSADKPEMPAGLPESPGEEAALRFLLECFTRDEAASLAEYLKMRYGDQLDRLIICPVDLPVPLGIGPVAQIPESARSGFINFDLAQGYSLPFTFKGYYDLNESPANHDG